MFKKAGIVVGIAIIALALGLQWMFGGDENSGAGGGKTQPAPVVSKEEKSVPKEEITQVGGTNSISAPKTVERPEPQPVQKEVVSTGQVTQPEKKKPKQEFIRIDESSMGQAVISRSEVMVVSKKEVIVLDGNVGTTQNKQLAYAVQLLSGSDTMSLFLNGDVYRAVSVGEKLKVDYKVYRNNKGVDFPVIMNAVVVK